MGGVAEMLPANKLATREDADKVAFAAAQNDRRHASGGRELTRSIQSRSESIRNPIPHRADVFFFSAGKAITVGRDKVRARTHSTKSRSVRSRLGVQSERRPSRFFSHPPRISRERAPRVDKRILIHSPPPLTRPSLSLSVTPSHPRPHPSRLSPVGSRGDGSDGVNCSRGPDPTVAVASAAPAGESGGGGGGIVSGRRIRWRLFRRVDPAVLYPLVLTLRAQACPTAVASALPLADLAEVVAAAFPVGRSSGPPHTPPLPQASPVDPAAAAATTLVAPTGGSGRGDLPDAADVPSARSALLLVVYLLFVYMMMMSLLRLILGFLCDYGVVAPARPSISSHHLFDNFVMILIWVWIEIEILFLGWIGMMWDIRFTCASAMARTTMDEIGL
uniref:Uncharacterized protein n=1 Tax=Oryza meridionalis TaxID=40149 RepID=A0A0E0CC64_9ORYZ